MKRICVVTATRAEYGYLKWLMKDVQADSSLELQVIATGTHLDKSQGHTVEQIIADGISVSAEVDVQLDNSSSKAICETMARYGNGFAEVFAHLQPDVVVVLGDRYELLPICSTAFMMQIPIAHLSGGDVTEGALDDGVRNAVTMLATYHFPITEDCAKNIRRMRGEDKNIFVTGSTSLDFFNRTNLMSREGLAENLGLDINKKWALCTLHSETKQDISYNVRMADNLISAMKESLSDFQIVITNANADLGGQEINKLMMKVADESQNQFVVVPSLGQKRYLSYMKQVELVLGNSSSGILESPYLGVPTVNIGERQKGRYRCENIIQSGIEKNEIEQSIKEVMSGKYSIPSTYWGDGNASGKIVKVLKNI
ncbi:UDP-N-acetylglucosamine 2-epimerase [uncultured Treponema sp.]|uniref:UDP-N-acetylglucosamine 2-epimerase n=1 Tax=uncultured Treponema sp. TaxID=162155 RepID=UPI00259838BF|nr:UDP-N-acetylglucosamine 2-epimerase [uncultured Treponema sp.]